MSVCSTCDDTHVMVLHESGQEVPCTFCPTPCQDCRLDGRGAYCTTTPCPCRCHRKARIEEAVLDLLWRRLVTAGLVNPASSDRDVVFPLGPRAVEAHDENRALFFVTLTLPVDLRGLEDTPQASFERKAPE